MSKSRGTVVFQRDAEIPFDAVWNRHVVVFDINLTNTYAHDPVATRIQSEFPQVFEEIFKQTMEGKLYPGAAFVKEIKGMKFVGLVICNRPFDTNYDDKETIEHHALMAIDDMITKVGAANEFVSSILGRHQKAWCTIYNRLNELKLNWTVMPD